MTILSGLNLISSSKSCEKGWVIVDLYELKTGIGSTREWHNVKTEDFELLPEDSLLLLPTFQPDASSVSMPLLTSREKYNGTDATVK